MNLRKHRSTFFFLKLNCFFLIHTPLPILLSVQSLIYLGFSLLPHSHGSFYKFINYQAILPSLSPHRLPSNLSSTPIVPPGPVTPCCCVSCLRNKDTKSACGPTSLHISHGHYSLGSGHTTGSFCGSQDLYSHLEFIKIKGSSAGILLLL